MDSQIAQDLMASLHTMGTKLDFLTKQQIEANELMGTLIDRLEANTQQMFDLGQQIDNQAK